VSRDKKFWESLLADVLVGKPWTGSRSSGGALLPCDRKMEPRMSDYGSGWAGPGFEVRARMTDYGASMYNRSFGEGRVSHSTGFGDRN